MVASSNSGNNSSLYAFVRESASVDAVKNALPKMYSTDSFVHEGDIVDATNFLAQNDDKVPDFLLVEIASAEDAPELLDKLADVCPPDVKVIVTSTVDEFSFYSWLMNIGIFSYLLQPFTEEDLNRAIETSDRMAVGDSDNSHEKPKEGVTISFIGTRGGAGTTSIVSNLAYIFSEKYQKKTMVFDCDIHFGSIAMYFDMQPERGLHNLLEHPERIDSLMLDRVAVSYSDNLSILYAEEPMSEEQSSDRRAAEAVICESKKNFAFTLIDVPRVFTPLTRELLVSSDYIAVVTEPSLLGLRDLLRIKDYVKESLGKPAPIVISNKEGKYPKSEIRKDELAKHYDGKIDYHIPYMADIFAESIVSGDIAAKINPKNTKPIYDTAASMIQKFLGETTTEAGIDTDKAKSDGLLGKIFGSIAK